MADLHPLLELVSVQGSGQQQQACRDQLMALLCCWVREPGAGQDPGRLGYERWVGPQFLGQRLELGPPCPQQRLTVERGHFLLNSGRHPYIRTQVLPPGQVVCVSSAAVAAAAQKLAPEARNAGAGDGDKEERSRTTT